MKEVLKTSKKSTKIRPENVSRKRFHLELFPLFKTETRVKYVFETRFQVHRKLSENISKKPFHIVYFCYLRQEHVFETYVKHVLKTYKKSTK